MSEKLVSGWVQLIQLVKAAGIEPDDVAELISDKLHLQLGNTVASKAHHERLAASTGCATVSTCEATAQHKLAAEEDALVISMLEDTLAECSKIHTSGGALAYGTREEFQELLEAMYCDEGSDAKLELRFVREDGCITFQGTIRSEDIKANLS